MSLLHEEKLTEKVVRDRLIRLLDPYKHLMMFNVQGVGPYRHEIDLIRVLPSGFCQEFEIKTNLADIKRETKKLAKHADFWQGAELQIGDMVAVCPIYPEGRRMNLNSQNCLKDAIGGETFRHSDWDKERKYNQAIFKRHRHPVREFYLAVPEEASLVETALNLLPKWAGVIELPGGSKRGWKECLKRPAEKSPVARVISQEERLYLYRRMGYKFWDLYKGYSGVGRS